MSFHQDLALSIRDMHEASLLDEYVKKTPLLSLILKQGNMKFDSGEFYTQEMDTGPNTDRTQDYSVNDQLTHAQEDTMDRYTFGRKYFQRGYTLDIDEELQNNGSNGDTILHNLAVQKVKKVQEEVRLHLRKLIYGAASDSSKIVQGLNSALIVDSTYGQLDRTKASSIRDWWQPADNVYTTGTQATETTISLAWLQEIADPLTDLETSNGDFTFVMGPTLFLAVLNEAMSASIAVTPNPKGLFKYGIKDVEINGMSIMRDPFLASKYNTSSGLGTTGSAGGLERRVYGLNIPDWELLIHPKRNFAILDPFDQAQIANGRDYKLGRVRFAGNLICTHPNRSIYMSNVIP